MRHHRSAWRAGRGPFHLAASRRRMQYRASVDAPAHASYSRLADRSPSLLGKGLSRPLAIRLAVPSTSAWNSAANMSRCERPNPQQTRRHRPGCWAQRAEGYGQRAPRAPTCPYSSRIRSALRSRSSMPVSHWGTANPAYSVEPVGIDKLQRRSTAPARPRRKRRAWGRCNTSTAGLARDRAR